MKKSNFEVTKYSHWGKDEYINSLAQAVPNAILQPPTSNLPFHNPMNKLIFTLLSLGALAGIVKAQVTTAAVGFVNINAAANTDTRISVPLTRSVIFNGQVSAIVGNELTINGASWTAGQFVQNGTIQPDAYYIRVTSGSLTGKWFTINANTATSVTVDPANAQSLQTQGVVAPSGIGAVSIFPFWTLSTLFPSQSGITASTNPFAPNGTLILFNNPNAIGTNVAPSITYLYHDGSSGFLAAGWYDVGNLFGGKVDNAPIAPDEHFVMRNSGSARTMTITGGVPTTTQSTDILRNTITQDNPVTQPFPVPASPSDLKLFESGAFTASSNVFAPEGDLLLQFDTAATGYNLAPSKTYLYHNGSSGFLAAGWYDVGSLFSGAVTTTKLFVPGEALIIRKASGATQQLVSWGATLPYTP